MLLRQFWRPAAARGSLPHRRGSTASAVLDAVTPEQVRARAASRNAYIQRVEESTMPVPVSAVVDPDVEVAAPCLHGVDPWAPHLRVRHVPVPDGATAGAGPTPACGRLEVVLPFSTDPPLQDAWRDLGPVHWAPLRLGKFFEALDAITADVAYRHVQAGGADTSAMSLVTAGHYDSQKLRPSSLNDDVKVRSYVIATGRSTVEVRTDVLQDDSAGVEQLVTFSHTVMVALDPKSLGPGCKPRSVPVPALAVAKDDARGHERLALANHHKQHRARRSNLSMSLRDRRSSPPYEDEMRLVHALFREVTLQREAGERDPLCLTMAETAVESNVLVYSAQKNLHGKLFGGFIARHAYETAYIAALKLTAAPPVALGFDQMVFENAVNVGDLVKFSARVVHTHGRVYRVWVLVEVIDAQNPEHQNRTNKLGFVFLQPGPEDTVRHVVPESYSEVLMYLDALRWFKWQGPEYARFGDLLERADPSEPEP